MEITHQAPAEETSSSNTTSSSASTSHRLNVLLLITGSVAAIKAPELAASLSDSHYNVRIVVTQAAKAFLPPDFVSNVESDESEWQSWRKKGDPVLHIDLRSWADLGLVAPLSANTLAKVSNGLADNLVTSVLRAWDFRKPLLLAPAMNTAMWEHPLTLVQLQRISSWSENICIIDPVAKLLACGDYGIGAMAEVHDIVGAVKSVSRPVG